AHADVQAHRERRVEDPRPVLIAESSQQQEKEREVQPRPESPHPLEIAEQTVHARRREKSRYSGRDEECHQCPEDRLTAEIQFFPAKTQRKNQNGCCNLDESSKVEIARDDVGEKEAVSHDDRNEERGHQQNHDRRAPRRLREPAPRESHLSVLRGCSEKRQSFRRDLVATSESDQSVIDSELAEPGFLRRN